MNRYFITGGFGYIGLSFAHKALERGETVHLFDNLCYEQDYRSYAEVLSKYGDRFSFSIGDTRNLGYLSQSIKSFAPSHVMHWGDLSSIYACDHNPSYTETVCDLGTRNVVDQTCAAGAYLFYNSSSSVYGVQKIERLEPETGEIPEPTDQYCGNKLRNEEYIRIKKGDFSTFKVVIFRPATVFGIAPRFRIELLPNHFFYMGYSNSKIKIADENSYRSSIDVSDLVDGYFAVIEKGDNHDLVYNIGNQNMKKIDYAKAVQRHTDCEIISIKNAIDWRNLQIDSSKFSNEFSWQPKLTIDDSFAQIKDFFQASLNNVKQNNFNGLLNMPLSRWREISE